jgi:predicted PurR-regulated permease PerM
MDGLIYPLMVVMTFTVIQLIESNFLTPKIVGGNVNLNALVTFLGLLIGGAIWGVIGMILIIPTLAILKRIFELKNSTKPFAYLFGEEEIKPVFKSEKNER